MNLQRSIDVALAMRNETRADLARQLGVTGAGISVMISRNSTTTKKLTRIAEALNMRASDLIALGEQQ